MRLNKFRLLVTLKSSAGRTNLGIKSFRCKAALVCYNYRIIDFSRVLKKELAVIRDFVYVPGRTASIALCLYRNGLISYILYCKGLRIGSIISSCLDNVRVFRGNYLANSIRNYTGWANYLKNFSIGCFLHSIVCVSLANKAKFGLETRIACAAGAYAQVLKHTPVGIILRLNSGEHRIFSYSLVATFGVVSNIFSFSGRKKLRKAGQSRLLGFKPKVRGSAMNPVDHPHGGGAGRSSGKRGAFSPWGKFSKGTRTAGVRFCSRYILKKRYEK